MVVQLGDGKERDWLSHDGGHLRSGGCAAIPGLASLK
jgi:hypothetical protein